MGRLARGFSRVSPWSGWESPSRGQSGEDAVQVRLGAAAVMHAMEDSTGLLEVPSGCFGRTHDYQEFSQAHVIVGDARCHSR